jgi:hypothetical protein
MHESAIIMTSKHPTKHFLIMSCFIISSPAFVVRHGRSRSVSAMLLFSILWVAALLQSSHAAVNPSQNIIILDIDTTLDSIIFPGFSLSLDTQLTRNLSAAGYSIASLPPRNAMPIAIDSSAIVLTVSARSAPELEPRLVATTIPFREWRPAASNSTPEPLVVVSCPRGDTSGTATLLVAKKITENLRTRFICRLMLNSVPTQATVKSSAGLTGICPVEWNVAFGITDITAQKKGFLPKTIRLHLSETRNPDTATIILVKRMPYHSPAFWPAISLGALSAALYGCEYYYYRNYSRLNENDLKTNPDAFGTAFRRAQACEYSAGISLGLAGALFVVTFFW